MSEAEVAYGDVVSVWVGMFGSQEAVDAYTAEQWDNDEAPISEFAGDIGLEFYDDGLIEVHHEQRLWKKGPEAFAHHSYGESFADAAWAAVAASQQGEFDTALLLYGHDHKRHPQAIQ